MDEVSEYLSKLSEEEFTTLLRRLAIELEKEIAKRKLEKGKLNG